MTSSNLWPRHSFPHQAAFQEGLQCCAVELSGVVCFFYWSPVVYKRVDWEACYCLVAFHMKITSLAHLPPTTTNTTTPPPKKKKYCGSTGDWKNTRGSCRCSLSSQEFWDLTSKISSGKKTFHASMQSTSSSIFPIHAMQRGNRSGRRIKAQAYWR